MSEFEKAFNQLSKVSLENHIELWGEPKTERAFFEAGQASKQAEIDGLQKRVDVVTHLATELAEYASYAEIIGAVLHNRKAIREYCDKIFAHNRAIDLEEEEAMRGEHETK